MHAQLAAVVADLECAAERVRRLHASLSCHAWSHRPGPGRWSPAECVAHLNLTSAALLPRLRTALQDADTRQREPHPRSGPQSGPTPRRHQRYRRDAMGWLVWQIVAPSGGMKTTTVAAFEPTTAYPVDSVVSQFAGFQTALVACVRDADGLPLERVKVQSPFDTRVTVNLFSALTLVPRHQHRHLHQAERAAEIGAPRARELAV